MSSDISLQPESEFTSDMVKAVENIAVNVKLGSAEFSSSIDSLSKAIDGLKSSLIDSINSLKSSASNVAPSSPSASPRAAQGRSPSAQDPTVAKSKEDIKKAKLDLAALKLKTAQERANFNQEQLLLKIKKANEAESSRKKKKDSDTQNEVILDVFENVGKGFGDVFAVTKEQMAGMRTSGKKGKKEKPFEMNVDALSTTKEMESFKNIAEGFGALFAVTKEQMSGMRKSGKKGGKEKPFEMDMGALSTDKKAGPGVDIPENFVKDINASSDAWNNVFENVSKTAKQWKEIGQQQKVLMDAFQNVGDGFGEVFAVTKEQMAGMRTSGKKGKKEKPFEMDMGALSGSSVKKEAGKGVDIAPQFIGDIMNASAAWNNVFANAAESASKWKDVFSIADESKPKQTKEFDPGTDFADPIIRILEQTSEEIASVIPAIEYSGGPSYSAQEEPTEPYYSPFIGMPKEEPAFVGPTQENEARYNQLQQQLQEEDKIIKDGVGNFSVLFEAMFGKMGKSIQNVIATTVSGINQSFSDKSPVLDTVKSMFGFASVNKKVETSKSQTLSSGGTVGYFAKGTPKGGIFEGIGSVLGGKKKKKKSILNNDEDDSSSIFKPKGTDTVPAMLTPGEEVVKKSAAKKPQNKAAIDAMNKSGGGTVGYFAGGTPGGKGIVGGLASLALGPVGAAFSMITGTVKAASDAIAMFGGFVAKANPAVMEQVGLAMNDLQGVIGRALVPAVRTLLPVIRYMGDGMDFVMKMLMPAITPLVEAFKILAMPLIELEAVVAQFLAPAFEGVGIAIQGFAMMLDPVIQLVSEIVESFTELAKSFTGGISISKAMMDGFEILGQVMKILVGAIVTVLGLFMSGMGVIIQLAGMLIGGFGSLVKGIGDLLSYIPKMGTIGAALSAAGTAVGDAGQVIVKSGEELQKKGEDQRDRGVAKMGEGATNIIEKVKDPNYKMKDETRYKPGDVTGKGIKKGSSIGAAVRETQSTSISGVGDEIRKQALMAGTGAKTQEESLKDISDKLSKDNLRDAFKEGMIAANGADKGNAGIKGKDPFAGAGHSKPSLAPV